MTSLDEIRNQCHDVALPAGASVPSVRLDGDQALAPAIETIVDYFGGDRSRQAIHMVIEGAPAGYLERHDVYGFVASIDRGIGSGEGAMLPGYSSGYSMLELHCPVAGCPHSPVYAIAYDETDPPRCDVHSDAALRYGP